MRLWFRNIHCPSFICFFCKPPQHLCTSPAPDTNHNHRSTAFVVSAAATGSNHVCIGKKEEDELVDDETKTKSCRELILKSSIKRKAVEEGGTKSVKWMDAEGKELVQVKEFQTSESEDTDSGDEYSEGCICPIL